MNSVLIVSGAVAFALAVLRPFAPVGVIKAILSTLFSGIGIYMALPDAPIQTLIVAGLSSAFFGLFLEALADRIATIPRAVTSEVGVRRQV